MYGDGTKDAAVQHTLEGCGSGNSWGQSLAVFLNNKGAYKMAADEPVSGKFFRSFNVLTIVNTEIIGTEIIGAIETCRNDEPQGSCENPRRHR